MAAKTKSKFTGDPPSPKRPKVYAEDEAHQQPAKPSGKISDFVVSRLEDFYKPNPPFRLPVEIGSFSFNDKGDLQLDRSGLRYYTHTTKLGFDLKVGYDSYKPKLNQTPDLTVILNWVSHNWNCFLPKMKGQTSFDGKPLDDLNGSGPVVQTTAPPHSSTSSTKFHLRPDNLLTDFICWRGLMTKLLCTPFNKSEPWKLIATRHNDTIYLRELETPEKAEKEANMSSAERQMCYWGLKFEDYMTRKDPKAPPPHLQPDKPGTVNPLEAFCCIVRTRLNTHSLVLAGEVDCIDPTSREKVPQSYIELKTSRVIYTDRNKASFKRNKLMKWWAQSFLIGIPKIVCGFRDNEGIVQHLQTFKTVDIPRESQSDLSLWQGNVCLNFLDELLKWMKETIMKDSPQAIYTIEWKYPFTHISATCNPVSSDLFVLPDWYVNKLSPPSDDPPVQSPSPSPSLPSPIPAM